jgi:hypothetical protein
MSIDGTWYNELGSVLTISAQGSTVSGTYQTAVGNAKGIYPLIGFINSDTDPAVGWTVLWSNQYGDSNSLTVWAGQYYSEDNVIVTMWLLRTEAPETQNWAATQVGEDIFYPSQAQAQARGSVASLRAPAHPPSA